jgi:hypothetical protein
MGFLRRGQGPEQAEAARATALVVEAVAPPEGGPTIGPGSHGAIRVLVDGQTLEANARMTEDHWLVPGQEVSVTVTGDRLEIDWDQVPSMPARAAANDPTLADPIAARRKAARARGLTSADTGNARTERFRRALEQRSSQPAPPGRARAVVLLATIRGRRRIVGDANNDSTHDMLTYERKSAAVLSVHVPGRAPYALYRPRFKCEVDLLEPLWTPLPALVSTTDPEDVEILWSEVPDHQTQLMDRVAASRAAQQAQLGRVDEIRGALGQADPTDGSSMRAQMQQLAAENARRSLSYVKDPKTRRMLIEQYRAAGIDLGEDG